MKFQSSPGPPPLTPSEQFEKRFAALAKDLQQGVRFGSLQKAFAYLNQHDQAFELPEVKRDTRASSLALNKEEDERPEVDFDLLEWHAIARGADEGRPRLSAVCHAARRLGSISRRERSKLVQELSQTPLWSPASAAWSLGEWARAAQEFGAPYGLMPRALRTHLAGGWQLRPAQLARHQTRLIGQVTLLRCCSVEQAAQRALRERLGLVDLPSADSDDALHALALAQFTDLNRRALQRHLRHHFNGNADSIAQHPLSRAWVKAHSGVDETCWRRGLTLRDTPPDVGPVTLSVEQDLLQVLKLGTVVGSCLGLGGGLSFSAAAVALDINKQVVYARNEKGKVIARQVLAISKGNHLVAFSVYPLSTPVALAHVFLDYDRRFAQALGLPLALHADTQGRDEEACFDVEEILSRDFWFDGLWEPPE